MASVGADAVSRVRRRERVRADARARTAPRLRERARRRAPCTPASPSSPPVRSPRRRRSLPGVHAVLPAVGRGTAPATFAPTPARVRLPDGIDPARCPSSPTWSTGTRAPDVDAGRRDGGPARGSTRGPPRRSRATTTTTTTSPPTPRRGSRRTCTSAACPRWRSRTPSPDGTAPTRSCGSSAGATSTPRSSPPDPTPRGPTTGRAATVERRPAACSPRGRRAGPAIPSSTPPCASSRARASCTTAPA